MLPVLLNAATPSWWSERGVIDPNGTANDYSAVNQGQLKNITVKAVAELNQSLSQFGGAGPVLDQLSASLSGTTANTNDYTAVNLGQLKTLARPFYDRLLSIGFQGHPLESGTYPWISGSASDYAMANIGQVKNLFGFDVTSSTDRSGLPDWWEKLCNVPPGTSGTSIAPRGGGLSYLDAYQQGVNPNIPPPTVSLTGTSDYETAPATITLTALPRVSDTNDAIAAVNFYQGTTWVGSATSSPYVLVLPNQSPGNYSFTVVATDSHGITGTSSPAEVDVRTEYNSSIYVYYRSDDTPNAVPGVPRSLDVIAWGDSEPAPVMFQSDSGVGTFSLEANPAAPHSSSIVARTDSSNDDMLAYWYHSALAYFTAPETSGTYTVQASVVGGAGSVSFAITTLPLVGYWRFWDDQTTVERLGAGGAGPYLVRDLSKTGNWAMIHGEFETAGSFDDQDWGAILLDGSTTFVEVSMDAAPAFGVGPVTPSLVFETGPMTLAAWIQLPSPAQLSTENNVYDVLRSGTAGGPVLEFALSGGTNNGLFCLMTDGTSTQTIACASDQSAVLADGNWHHVAFARNGAGTGTLFIDGEIVGTQIGMGLNIDSTAEWQMGGGTVFSGFPWAMDAIQMQRIALDQNDVKALFNVDSDGNGLPDWWETKYFGRRGVDPNAIADIDGNTFLQKYLSGGNPLDYFMGKTPVLTIAGGDAQVVAPTVSLSAPLVVKVVDARNGLPLVNAPVNFEIASGGGALQDINGGTQPRTDANGLAQIWFTAPGTDAASQIVAFTESSGHRGASVTFQTRSVSPPAPSGLWGEPIPGGEGIRLHWTDNAKTETGYIIEKQMPDGSWAVVGLVPANSTEFDDSSTWVAPPL